MKVYTHLGETLDMNPGWVSCGIRITSFEFTYHERAKWGEAKYDEWILEAVWTRFKVGVVCYLQK